MGPDKWAAGNHYGPVLSQTDLFLLAGVQPLELQINPILTRNKADFSLVFNVCTGSTGGFNDQAPQDLPFLQVHEPATLPRIQDMVIISEISPWCTQIHNPEGVTLGDICNQIYKDYTENNITEAEYNSCPARFQEQIRRANASNSGMYGGSGYYPSTPNPGRFKRVDWLRDRVFFEVMNRGDGSYVTDRLGYNAPNVFVVKFTAYN